MVYGLPVVCLCLRMLSVKVSVDVGVDGLGGL